ncbi:MAG TPA: ABC transporter ATP-binding protein [Vicinamibacterales bacterium]|jgi:ABC-2 type transport system ATP-binding protein
MITAVENQSSLPAHQSPRATPVAVSVQGVTKRFLVRRPFKQMLRHPFRREWAQALNDLSCEIRSGEFFGFLGANGAGKTTLFKILATLIIPDRGIVTIDGINVASRPSEVRRILTPVIADERSLRWRLSARENLRLYAVLYEVPSGQVDSRVDEVLDLVKLDPRDTKLVGRFSSGMKQRLLIARALLARPRILLLDEPTRSLDPVSARELRTFLREQLCRTLGCTVLLATHTTEEAFEFCDRVAILNKGRLVAVGPTEQLAMKFCEERYRLWTRTPAHPAIETLAQRGLATEIVPHGLDDDGWAKIDIEIPGGLEAAARALALLTERGVVAARFERIGLSLGELIQRVTRQGGAHA